MNCPNCKNVGFKPSDEFLKPIKNLGGKKSYDATDVRRYVCLQCGFRFYTYEAYSHPVGDGLPQPTEQGELKFKNG